MKSFKKIITDNPKNYSEITALTLRKNNTIPKYKSLEGNLPAGKKFERSVWRLFFKMGAKVFNNKNELKLDFSSFPQANQSSLQIDNFFIMRDGYVFFIECKETLKAGGKNASNLIRQELAGWSHNRKLIRKRFYQIFGKSQGYKIIHVIATSGYDWKSPDIKKLENKNEFILLRNEEIEYFYGCYENSKSSWFTFNQFLGTFRKGYGDFNSSGKPKKIVAFRTQTNFNSNQDSSETSYVYTSSMKVKDLLRISSVSHHSGAKIYDLGTAIKASYQRILTSKRLNRKSGIPSFIEKVNKPFINNLLINYRGQISLDDQFTALEKLGEGRGGELSFVDMSPGMFHLIDGQHRLFGYCPLFEEDEQCEYGEHELIITIFDNLSGIEEAKLFLDINKKQEKINANLVLEIEELSGADGDYEQQSSNISKAIVDHLKLDKTSPFHEPKAIREAQKETDIYGNLIPQGSLTPLGMKKYIQNSIIISTQNDDFTTGLAFKNGTDITDKFKGTIDNAKSIYLNYFKQIRKANNDLWVKKTNRGIDSNNEKIASNIPIGGLQLLLNHFVKEEVSGQGQDISKAIQVHVDVLTRKLKKLSKKDENDLFNAGIYGGSGPVQFYYSLLEKFFNNLISKKLQSDIDKSRKKFQDKNTVLIVDPALEKENKQLQAELKKEKSPSRRAVIIRKQFANYLDPFLMKIYGLGYWEELIGVQSEKVIDDAHKKAKNEMIKRKDEIKGQPEEKEAEKRPRINWLEWKEWRQIIEFLFKKSSSLDSYLSDQCLNSKIYIDDYKSDVKNIIRNTFFISKNIKQNDLNVTLDWMRVLAKTRRFDAHPDDHFQMTEKEEKSFLEIEDSILKVIAKLRDFNL